MYICRGNIFQIAPYILLSPQDSSRKNLKGDIYIQYLRYFVKYFNYIFYKYNLIVLSMSVLSIQS